MQKETHFKIKIYRRVFDRQEFYDITQVLSSDQGVVDIGKTATLMNTVVEKDV